MTMRRVSLVLSTFASLALVGVVAQPGGADLTAPGTVRPIPTGNAQSSPDAVVELGTNRITVVVRGTDTQLWFNRSINGGQSWSGWIPLPHLAGGVQGDPTVVSWAPGRIDVFVRGADDKLWQTTQFDVFGVFGAWIKPVGDEGVLASSPEAVVRGEGRLDVFVLGTDGQIYQRFWLNNSWNGGWIPHGEPAGTTSLVGEPAAVWSAPISPERLDVYARGSDDKLWQRTWNGVAWSEWVRPIGDRGVLASSPEATRFSDGTGDLTAVFVRGTDGGLWGIDFRPSGWGNWVRLGGPGDTIVDSPGADFGPLGLEIFVRTPSNLVHQFTVEVPRVVG